MKTRTEYIQQISAHTNELKTTFGIRSLRLFGSVSRNEQKDGSDIDVCVDMPAEAFTLVRLKRYLDHLLECPVDVVRVHHHMNPFLTQEIDRDGIYVIK